MAKKKEPQGSFFAYYLVSAAEEDGAAWYLAPRKMTANIKRGNILG